jgi:hypothetical protein
MVQWLATAAATQDNRPAGAADVVRKREDQ